MAKLITGMELSLDGFFEDANGGGTGGESLAGTDYLRDMIAQTGAVIMGRRTFEMADDPDLYVGHYEFQVPIFVLTSTPPAKAPKQDENLTFTFVTDGLESAVRQAKAAAGDKDVQAVGGVQLIRDLVRTGLADELHVNILPVLLGSGRALFGDLGRIDLEKIDARELGSRTLLRFRVKP